jgi:hypothetical protein
MKKNTEPIRGVKMTDIIVINTTLIKVKEELENFLEIYTANKLYQKTLTDPDLRQKLIAYILNRMPNRYLAVERENISLVSSQNLIFSTQEALEIEKLIHQGIYYLNQKSNFCDFYYNYPTFHSNFNSN